MQIPEWQLVHLVDDLRIGARHPFQSGRRYAEEFASFDPSVEEARRRLVTDAMTSGGLLVAVDPGRAGEVPGVVVGRLVDGEAGAIRVR